MGRCTTFPKEVVKSFFTAQFGATPTLTRSSRVVDGVIIAEKQIVSVVYKFTLFIEVISIPLFLEVLIPVRLGRVPPLRESTLS